MKNDRSVIVISDSENENESVNQKINVIKSENKKKEKKNAKIFNKEITVRRSERIKRKNSPLSETNENKNTSKIDPTKRKCKYIHEESKEEENVVTQINGIIEETKNKEACYTEKLDNEIDKELFGDEELELLNKKDLYEENEKKDEIQNNEFSFFNESEFLHFEEADSFTSEEEESFQSDVDTSYDINENNNDVNNGKLSEIKRKGKGKETETWTETGTRIGTDTETDKEKGKRKSTNKKMRISKREENNNEREEIIEDENFLRSCKQKLNEVIKKREKQFKTTIEKNKLITYLICWMVHLRFLNDICNNELLQAIIYSVYINYGNGSINFEKENIQKNEKNINTNYGNNRSNTGNSRKLYKDPVYIFLFIKNYIDLIIDNRKWISDKLITTNFKGHLLFRIIRSIQRRKANNVLINLIFVSLCRCLGIPSRLCFSLPIMKNKQTDENKINIDKKFVKELYQIYRKDIKNNLFFKNIFNTLSEKGYKTEEDEEEKEKEKEQEEKTNMYTNCKEGNESENHDVSNDNFINVDYESMDNLFSISSPSVFTCLSSKKDSKKTNTSFKNFYDTDMTQFRIFSECYSTSAQKWVSFFFCFSLYYYNLNSLSKVDVMNVSENKSYHIWLPMPKNPEEVVTIDTQKNHETPKNFFMSLFINKEKEKGKEKNPDIKKSGNNSSTSDNETDTSSSSYDSLFGSLSPINKFRDNLKKKETEKEKKKVSNSFNVSRNKWNDKQARKKPKEDIKILSLNYKKKLYFEKDNRIYICDAKTKKLLTIVYVKTNSNNKTFFENIKKTNYIEKLKDNLFEYENEDDKAEIVYSFCNIYDTSGKKGMMLHHINTLKNINKKMKKESYKTKKNSFIYGELLYDKNGNEINNLDKKFNMTYIKVYVNSYVFKFFYNLDHYNLYIGINKYNIFRDISVRHKVRQSGNKTKHNIISCDQYSHTIRESFRKLVYILNKKNYDDLEKCLDTSEDNYLYNLYVTNMMPTQKAELIKSPFYILKSFIKKNQTVYPQKPIGLFEGELVYLKQHVYDLQTKERLENKYFYISDSEQPIKYGHNNERDKIKVALYAQYQLKRREQKNVENTLTDDKEEIIRKNVEQNESFDYTYEKKDREKLARIKLFSHMKSNHIIELHEEDICIYNIQLKYILKYIKGKIPYKIIYNTSYFAHKMQKDRKHIPFSNNVNKIVIKKKDFPLFKQLYLPHKKKEDANLIREQSNKIKNIWKVLFKSILFEKENKISVANNVKAKKILKGREFNVDMDTYFKS